MLPDVPNRPQTQDGGLDPQMDCFEENAASLSRRYGGNLTVRDGEVWLSGHGDDPAFGTDINIGSAMLAAHNLPNHVAVQDLDDAASRDHYCIAAVDANAQGIPTVGGGHPHYVTYLGDGWYRNPANGTLTNSPTLAPAYSGKCVEIDLPAGGDGMDLALLTRSDGGTDPDGAGAIYLAEVARKPYGTIPVRKRHIGSPADAKPYLDAGMKVEQVHGVLLDRAEDGPIIASGVYPKEQ